MVEKTCVEEKSARQEDMKNIDCVQNEEDLQNISAVENAEGSTKMISQCENDDGDAKTFAHNLLT